MGIKLDNLSISRNKAEKLINRVFYSFFEKPKYLIRLDDSCETQNQSKWNKIEKLLDKWKLKGIEPKSVSDIATNHIKEMAGLENHLYVKPLNELMNKDERFDTVKALFLIAASDGSVESVESEEIRLINKGLELSHQHFVAARAEVKDFLKTLK